MISPERRGPTSTPWVVTEVEVVNGSFDPAIDGPSNAQVLCAGVCTRGTLLVLVGVELAWMVGQLTARWLIGRCFDPPPFVILHRANLFLLLAVLVLVFQAGKDTRDRQRARFQRERLRREKAEEVRESLHRELVRHVPEHSTSLH